MAIPVDLERCVPSRAGGLLTAACPLPEDWERGVSFVDDACLSPTVMGECPTCPGLKPAQRASIATFKPYRIIAPVECSTFGGTDVDLLANRALDQTIEFGLARELLTGEASARDGGGNPSLQCSAIDLGADFDTVGGAFACVEAALAEATSGRSGYILVGPQLATLANKELVRDGSRWITRYGTRVVVSAGFDGRAPGCVDDPDCDTVYPGPAAGDPLYVYATAGLWAATGRRDVFGDINRATNTATARAEQIALATFSPCAVFAAASTAATACDTNQEGSA